MKKNMDCLTFPPTFSHIPDLEDSTYVNMTIYNQEGNPMYNHKVYRVYDYVIMYFELIKSCHYDKEKINKYWNQWWNTGVLDEFKQDLSQLLQRI